MDGENNEKPYEQMDDLGGFTPLFLETSKCFLSKTATLKMPLSWTVTQSERLEGVKETRFFQSYRLPPRNSRPYDQGLWKPIGFP